MIAVSSTQTCSMHVGGSHLYDEIEIWPEQAAKLEQQCGLMVAAVQCQDASQLISLTAAIMDAQQPAGSKAAPPAPTPALSAIPAHPTQATPFVSQDAHLDAAGKVHSASTQPSHPGTNGHIQAATMGVHQPRTPARPTSPSKASTTVPLMPGPASPRNLYVLKSWPPALTLPASSKGAQRQQRGIAGPPQASQDGASAGASNPYIRPETGPMGRMASLLPEAEIWQDIIQQLPMSEAAMPGQASGSGQLQGLDADVVGHSVKDVHSMCGWPSHETDDGALLGVDSLPSSHMQQQAGFPSLDVHHQKQQGPLLGSWKAPSTRALFPLPPEHQLWGDCSPTQPPLHSQPSAVQPDAPATLAHSSPSALDHCSSGVAPQSSNPQMPLQPICGSTAFADAASMHHHCQAPSDLPDHGLELPTSPVSGISVQRSRLQPTSLQPSHFSGPSGVRSLTGNQTGWSPRGSNHSPPASGRQQAADGHGASLSAPLVAGRAALLLQQRLMPKPAPIPSLLSGERAHRDGLNHVATPAEELTSFASSLDHPSHCEAAQRSLFRFGQDIRNVADHAQNGPVARNRDLGMGSNCEAEDGALALEHAKPSRGMSSGAALSSGVAGVRGPACSQHAAGIPEVTMGASSHSQYAPGAEYAAFERSLREMQEAWQQGSGNGMDALRNLLPRMSLQGSRQPPRPAATTGPPSHLSHAQPQSSHICNQEGQPAAPLSAAGQPESRWSKPAGAASCGASAFREQQEADMHWEVSAGFAAASNGPDGIDTAGREPQLPTGTSSGCASLSCGLFRERLAASDVGQEQYWESGNQPESEKKRQSGHHDPPPQSPTVLFESCQLPSAVAQRQSRLSSATV